MTCRGSVDAACRQAAVLNLFNDDAFNCTSGPRLAAEDKAETLHKDVPVKVPVCDQRPAADLDGGSEDETSHPTKWDLMAAVYDDPDFTYGTELEDLNPGPGSTGPIPPVWLPYTYKKAFPGPMQLLTTGIGSGEDHSREHKKTRRSRGE